LRETSEETFCFETPWRRPALRALPEFLIFVFLPSSPFSRRSPEPPEAVFVFRFSPLVPAPPFCSQNFPSPRMFTETMLFPRALSSAGCPAPFHPLPPVSTPGFRLFFPPYNFARLLNDFASLLRRTSGAGQKHFCVSTMQAFTVDQFVQSPSQSMPLWLPLTLR